MKNSIIKSLFFIAFGVILLVVETDTQYALWGVIPLNLKVLGVISLVLGVLVVLTEIVKNKK